MRLYNINESRKLSLNQEVLVKSFKDIFEIETITTDSVYAVKIKINKETKAMDTKKSSAIINVTIKGDVYNSQFGAHNTMINASKLVSELAKQGVSTTRAEELVAILKEEEQDTHNRTLKTRAEK
jgi:hypothetical protein